MFPIVLGHAKQGIVGTINSGPNTILFVLRISSTVVLVLRERLLNRESSIQERISLVNQTNDIDSLRRANVWQQAILDSTDFTIISTDLKGMILTCNASALRKLGYRAEEIIGRTTPIIFHDAEEVRQRASELSRELGRTVEPAFDVFVARARAGIPDENDWTYVCKDGRRFPVRLSVTSLRDDAGNVAGFLVIGKELTSQSQVEDALRENDARFHSFMDNTPIMAYIKDESGRLIYVNQPLLRRFEKRSDEVIGKTDSEIWPPEIAAPLQEHDRMILENDLPITLEETAPTPDGRSDTWLSFKFPMRDGRGRRFLAGMSVDITDRKYYERQLEEYQHRLEMAITELEKLSLTDALTGLRNKRAFQQRLDEEVARAHRYQLRLSLLILDVDHFKAYNDTFGHPAGDDLLQQAARLLESHARPSDFLARIGGEEFAVILPGTPAQGAFISAERLRKSIESAIWTKRRITVSIGLAELSTKLSDSSSLIKAADEALYRAKSQGRNQVAQASDVKKP